MQVAGFDFPRTKPEFSHLPEEEIWAALDRNDDNRVACEVTRLICCFWKQFRDYAQKHKNMPPQIMHIFVRCPIERVAVMMLIGFIESETGISAAVTRH